MSRSLHMRRPPRTVGREAGYGGGGYDAADDWEGSDDGDDKPGSAYGTHGDRTATALRDPRGVDRQATRLAELQARFAELRAKAESEAMEELVTSRRSGGNGGPGAWAPGIEQRGVSSRESSMIGAMRPSAVDPQRHGDYGRQSRPGTARKGSGSNVAWLEKIKREVDSTADAAEAEPWYPEAIQSETGSQGTTYTERSTLRSRPIERSHGGRSSGGRSSGRTSSPPRDTSSRHALRHKLPHGSGRDAVPSRDEIVKLAARARAQQAFGDADFRETRSTHKLLQGQLAQHRHQQALQDRRKQRDVSSRRPVSAPRARSNGRRARSVRFEQASPPPASAREDTRGKFGVESTGREPPLRNSGRVRNARRAVSAPRERRAKEPLVKQPWRSAAPAKGKEDPFELAGEFSFHKKRVARKNYSKTDSATTVMEVEVSADLLARVERCGVQPAKLAILKQKLKAHSYGQTGQNPNKLFKHFDRDNTGQLELEEFKAAVRKGGHMTYKQISDKELSKLFKSLDTDDSGDVGIDELTAFVWGIAAPSTAGVNIDGKKDPEQIQGSSTTCTQTGSCEMSAPEVAPTQMQFRNARSQDQAAAPSTGGLRETTADDGLQMAAALSQAAVAPGSPSAEWRQQQIQEAAAFGYVPSHSVAHSKQAWNTSEHEPSSYSFARPEEDEAGVTYIKATGYAQPLGGDSAADDSDGLREQTAYVNSGVPVEYWPSRMYVAAPGLEPEPEPEAEVRYGRSNPGGVDGSDNHQGRGTGIATGRQGMSMRQMRRRVGVDSKGRPPAVKIPVEETVVSESAECTAGVLPQMANPPPRQAKPRIDKISTRSVRLRWTTDHGRDQGQLQFFLYRSAYRNTGERVPDSVVEIPCGKEETWVDAFASKDQMAYQYGYVLIACNERGEFSPPSPVAMVRPKKDDRKPRPPMARGRAVDEMGRR